MCGSLWRKRRSHCRHSLPIIWLFSKTGQLTLPGKAKAGKQVTVKVSWNY